MPMANLQLQILGRLELRRFGITILERRRKLLVLLAYLARRPGTPVARAQLASLFWPESDEPHARQSLRQALVELRQVVGEGLEVLGDCVRLRSGTVAVDATAFERELNAGKYAAARRLWSGDLLPAQELTLGEELRCWLEAEREHLRRKRMALEKALPMIPAEVETVSTTQPTRSPPWSPFSPPKARPAWAIAGLAGAAALGLAIATAALPEDQQVNPDRPRVHTSHVSADLTGEWRPIGFRHDDGPMAADDRMTRLMPLLHRSLLASVALASGDSAKALALLGEWQAMDDPAERLAAGMDRWETCWQNLRWTATDVAQSVEWPQPAAVPFRTSAGAD